MKFLLKVAEYDCEIISEADGCMIWFAKVLPVTLIQDRRQKKTMMLTDSGMRSSLMNLDGKKFAVIGGGGLIGSHVVDELLKEDVERMLVYDNMLRGSAENLESALKDPRVKIYDVGGGILQTDILGKALEGVHGVFI